MAPFDATTASGFPGATLFPALFPMAADEMVVVPEDILEREAFLVPDYY